MSRKLQYHEFEVFPLDGRQEVRELLYKLFASLDGGGNLPCELEALVNEIIDIAIEEAVEKIKDQSTSCSCKKPKANSVYTGPHHDINCPWFDKEYQSG